jgi:hypothetical protein
VPKSYPSLREALDKIEERRIEELNVEDEEQARKKAKKVRDRERATFFCVGFSSIWGEPLHKELKRLRNKHNLKWLRTAMSYHKFSTLGEKFNSDLSGKIMKGVYDLEWSDRACNCNSKTLLDNGHCLYKSQCRKSLVVYNLECKLCDSHYVGKTQQYLNDHFYDVWKVVETGKKKFGPNWKGSGVYARADAFAKHFAQHCRDCSTSNEVRQKLKTIVTPTIIWQDDGIRCAKTARTLQCKICMTERKEILHRFCTDKSKIMNDNSDIYSSCKCKGIFHRFGRKLHIETLRKRSPQKKSQLYSIFQAKKSKI